MDRFFCASSASTAIMDQRAIVRRAHRVPISDHVYVHGRRKNQPHLPMIPCSFDQLPIDPKPLYERCRRSFSSAQCSDRDQLRRKSSADIHDQRRKSTSSTSRYRISDGSTVPFIDWLSETDATLVPSDHHKEAASNPRLRLIMRSNDEYRRPSPAPLRSSSTRSRNQVVVLRVSVHCKGCEEKLRKHLSKMEGVASFSIDLPTKKVTVIGDVTPLGVLASVSKVKKAQLWSSPTSSSPSPSSRWSA
ncbi:putative heavy metal-associated domain, HMA [Rosa chinensis]|uniref:Putative heavy metal-associated domain, HMA n=1 Tax=Rosa chinensis TaxID=74649 RepID=A0A2P6QI86_ROSCH|nr:protein SODIUM POTASSIUM ROOT DEFECTIVE 3 [Rosa chinensis]PRQ33873.1 putative heavy metal-associated domain, HMA [Rosa chinensis]